MNFKYPFTTRNSLVKAGVLLLILAIADTLSTDYGLRTAHIEEANPLMRFVYDASIFGFYSLKICLPLLLLYLLTKVKPKPFLRLLTGAALLLYTVVLLQHIFWITVILSV